MTSPAYIARVRKEHAWSPLAASDRKWESLDRASDASHSHAPSANAAAATTAVAARALVASSSSSVSGFDPTVSVVRSPVAPMSSSPSPSSDSLNHHHEAQMQTQQRVAGNSDGGDSNGGSSGSGIVNRHHEGLVDDDNNEDDLAVEAGLRFGGHAHLRPGDHSGDMKGMADLNSVGAPRLKTEHIWGMRDDWGDRAGRWGRGAQAYRNNKQQEEPEGDEDRTAE
jgi:hypothetical protein